MQDSAVGNGASTPEWLGGVGDGLGLVGLVLYIGAYLVLQLGLIRGDGWLFPALNLVGALCLVVSLIDEFNLHVMLVEIAWAVISVIGLIRLYVLHRSIRFTPDERAAIDRLVPGMPKDRARALLARGAWTDASPGEVLTREGEPVARLHFLAEGVCRIEIGGTPVAGIGPGSLIGEMTYHTGDPATATVIAETPARLLVFERRAFETFLGRNEDIRAAIEQAVAGDLRRKLAVTSQAVARSSHHRSAPRAP
jgi:hypothetical protein